MRIAMIGQKGLPATYGGVERHVEELGKRLVAHGHEVLVYTRPNYADRRLRLHEGIELRSIPTIPTKHLDAIVHCALSAIDSRHLDIDIVHFHAIGPSIVAPLARKKGRALVATIHARDWQREKWGSVASGALKAGEQAALYKTDAAICVSRSLTEHYHADGASGVTYIPNGIAVPAGDDTSVLAEHGLEDGRYILCAGRIVPEKGVHYLLAAWRAAGRPLPLVIAGDTSYSDAYVAGLKSAESEGAVFTGYEYGDRLAALFRHAALFVLPSDLEGLPIVLLEALAYGVPVLASDIVPNVEVLGDNGDYFRAGDVENLMDALARCLAHGAVDREKLRLLKEAALQEYDWERIAEETLELYSRTLDKVRGTGGSR